MTAKRVGPEEALRMMQDDGYVYIDVRTAPEFDAGHPAGAFNVPVQVDGNGGRTDNPRFLETLVASFPKDAKIVLGCRSGARSLRALGMLEGAGYVHVVDQRAGFVGADEPGWEPRGLPSSRKAEPGRSYEELSAKARGSR